MKEQKEAKNVNELFKSIENEESNRRKELEETTFETTQQTVAAPKVAAPKAQAVAPRAQAVAPKVAAPKATNPVTPPQNGTAQALIKKPASQAQTTNLIKKMDNLKPKSLVQKSSQ